MTPQTPQGAALSDADIAELVKDIHNAIAELAGVARYPDLTEAIDRLASCAADRRLTAEQPVAWEGAEEWEPLAWELCANECGEDACNELIWEGGAVPEPWGERWLKYEGEAKRLIAMVRKYAPAPVTAEQGGADEHAALLEFYRASTNWNNTVGAEEATAEDERAAEARYDAAREAVAAIRTARPRAAISTPRDSDALYGSVIAIVAKFALAGHISEKGVTTDACGALRAALTTQPPAEPVEDPIQERVLLRAAQPQAEPADARAIALREAAEREFAYSGRHIGPEEAAALATPTAPTEPT